MGINGLNTRAKMRSNCIVNPAAKLAVVTILAILLIAEAIALAVVDTNNSRPVTSAKINPGNRLFFNIGNPVSNHSPSLKPLAPGLYEITNYPLADPLSEIPGISPFEIGSPVSDFGGAKVPAPGLYETHPYAMVLKVPNSTADNCILRNSSSRAMPIQHPQLEVIPNVVAVSQDKK